jgi:hypothetical protein
MKKIIFIFICFLYFTIGFSQTKKNIEPYDVLFKVLNYSNFGTSKYLIFNGNTKVGDAGGESLFDFSKSKKSFPNVIVTYNVFLPNRVLKATEGGSLKNLKFSNIGGGYNTLSIIGDWVTFDKGYGSGVFELTIYDEKNPNLIYIAIIGKGFKYWLNIKVEESDKFQELVNILTISGKPIDIVNANKSYELKKIEKQLKIERDFENEKKEKEALIERNKAEEWQKIKDAELRELNEIVKFNASIIDNSITFGNLIVAQNDFPEPMGWEDAKKACEKLGEGWRLPTKDELKILFRKKDKIGGLSDCYYWSSSEYGDDKAWAQARSLMQFANGKEFVSCVRAIRTL